MKSINFILDSALFKNLHLLQFSRYNFSFGIYLAATAFAREIVAFTVFPVKQFLRIVRSFVAVADSTLACAMAAADLSSLIVGFTVSHRD